jgi:hypothetical protein
MNHEISRKAALAMRNIPWDKQEDFVKAVQYAEKMSDIPQPYRSWVEGKTPSRKTD